MKFGVSGCTRECSEAQGKDVGLIATDSGWNLYVCGNGGMKPRHASLLATDLDKATLIKYLDRFMMFYVRTADKLTRTSVWLENLEGGIEYLQQVIMNDKLGINDKLEKEMAESIDNFHCEWATTLKDEQQLQRFSHFINSDAQDDNVIFTPERGQKRPAFFEEKAPVYKISLEEA